MARLRWIQPQLTCLMTRECVEWQVVCRQPVQPVKGLQATSSASQGFASTQSSQPRVGVALGCIAAQPAGRRSSCWPRRACDACRALLAAAWRHLSSVSAHLFAAKPSCSCAASTYTSMRLGEEAMHFSLAVAPHAGGYLAAAPLPPARPLARPAPQCEHPQHANGQCCRRPGCASNPQQQPSCHTPCPAGRC